MIDPKRYKATIEFEAYETPPGLPPLKERIRRCIEGHPTLSFAVEKVRVEDLASGEFDELVIHRSKHDIGLPLEVSNFKYIPDQVVGKIEDFEVVAGNVSGDEEISRVVGRINESDADIVEVSPTMFGPGTFYRVDRRTDPPTVSLQGYPIKVKDDV